MAKFLFCLPLRLGVLLIAPIQFLITAAAAGIVWLALIRREKDSDLPTSLRISFIIFGIVYTVTALACVFGFIGAIFKKTRFISWFSFMMNYMLGFQIVSSIFYLVAFFRDGGKSVSQTVGNGTGITVCVGCTHLSKTVVVISAIIPLLVQAYVCYIVHSYRKRLAKEDAKKHAVPLTKSAYHPVQLNEEGQSLTHSGAYPYSEGAHSFGNSGKYDTPYNGGNYGKV
ncbi:hypothetical protein BD779DRAFT_1503881 [Infundibulicybe gibba]|nr:hypothetical protein BD779DRAFT_1503881 [Infundibulicybe gibba]